MSIAAAYLVLTSCMAVTRYPCGQPHNPPRTTVVIPQSSMDQCLRTANAYNKRNDRRAECVPAGERP